MSNLLCGDNDSVPWGHVWREMGSHDLNQTFEVFTGLAGIIRDRDFLGVY